MLSSRRSNTNKIGTHPVYSSVLRGAIPVVLGAIIVSNIAVLITAIVVPRESCPWYNYSEHCPVGKSGNIYPFYITGLTPLVALVASVVQGVLRVNRALGSVTIVVCGTFTSCLWVVYGCMGMYMGFGTYFYDPWMWLAIPGFFLNLPYIALGAAAVHIERRRRARARAVGSAAPVEQSQGYDQGHTQVRSQSQSQFRTAHKGAYTTVPTTVAFTTLPSYRASEETIIPSPEKAEKGREMV